MLLASTQRAGSRARLQPQQHSITTRCGALWWCSMYHAQMAALKCHEYCVWLHSSLPLFPPHSSVSAPFCIAAVQLSTIIWCHSKLAILDIHMAVSTLDADAQFGGVYVWAKLESDIWACMESALRLMASFMSVSSSWSPLVDSDAELG